MTDSLPPRPARRRALGAAVLLLGLAAARTPLEASMALHMLLVLPALVLAGFLLGSGVLAAPLERSVRSFDAHGLTTLLFGLLVSAYWMVPRTLELSIGDWRYELAKCSSLLLLGALLPGAARRANGIVQVFFLGNFCAMTAIVGMLYQDQPRQLCNAYTVDDQAIAGVGLVTLACMLAVFWCMRNYRDFTQAAATAPP